MHDFRKLGAWQRARTLTREIYELTEPWHWSEPLREQMRRAAVSIGSNIAEGSGRASDRDFARFLSIALGSLQELESQLLTAIDVALVKPQPLLLQDLARTRRAIVGLRANLK